MTKSYNTEPLVGDVIDSPEFTVFWDETHAGFDLERMTEPGVSSYGPPSKAGIARLRRFRQKYGRLPRVGMDQR